MKPDSSLKKQLIAVALITGLGTALLFLVFNHSSFFSRIGGAVFTGGIVAGVSTLGWYMLSRKGVVQKAQSKIQQQFGKRP